MLQVKQVPLMLQLSTWIKLLWDFSRPHTIIGSTISILVLYLLANQLYPFTAHLSLFLLTWFSALGCNVFITGFNQIYDIEIDKINKPFLPLADGRLRLSQAWKIVLIALVICLGISLYLNIYLFYIMLAISTIGAFYSMPFTRLKRHHLFAGLCIVVVRGLLVNLAIGYWFEYMIFGAIQQNSLVIPLTLVITTFSFAIAWFKDLNDVEGDNIHKIKTLPNLYSEKFALTLGSILVVGSLMISGYLVIQLPFLLISHVFLIIAYGLHLYLSDLNSTKGLYQFYIRFWVFFVGVYLIFGIQTFFNI